MVELYGKKTLSSVCYCRKKTHYTSNMAAAMLGTPGIFKIGKITIEKLQPRIEGASKIKNVLSNSIAGGVFNILETRFSYS